MVIAADLEPAEVGAKVTMKVLFLPAAIVTAAGATLNCEASVPFKVRVTETLLLPVLARVKLFREVLFTRVSFIAKSVIDTVSGVSATGAIPVPANDIVNEFPSAL